VTLSQVGSGAAAQIFRTGRDSQERNPGLEIEPPMALRHSYACIGRYAAQPPP
jgi:hypothetical protein